MNIKVCGLREPENIKAVAALAPDYMGFIFYGPSPRFADELDIEPLKQIPSTVEKTAVFVNESSENIGKLIEKYNFNAIQLHGGEGPEFCFSFRNRVKVFKAFGIGRDFDFTCLAAYIGKVDFFLFDAKADIYGGSGKTFDWSILGRYNLNVRFFLSGGISLENLSEIKNISHPQFYGVDLNSRFEIAPGLKNITQLEKAFDIIKQTTCK
jgi:phosphoribosylanthranilate isomerase